VREPSNPPAVPVRVRPFRPEDQASVSALIGRVRDFTKRDRRESRDLVAIAADPDAVPAFELRVATVGDDITGFVCFGRSPLTDATFDLFWIAVDPRHERNGVGSALLGAAEHRMRARRGRMVVIETSGAVHYRRQRAFYRKHGYRRVARIPDYFGPGEARIIYTKPL